MKKRVLAVFLSFLFCFILASEVKAGEAKKIGEVTVSNIGGSRVTLSWITAKKENAQIDYGDTDPFNKTAYDERGESYKGKTHHFTITGLKADTVYYYDIVSDGIRYDNNGRHYTVTTGPVLQPAIDSDIAYDRIFIKNSKRPVKDVIVDIKLKDGDGSGTSGQSQLCSSVVDDNGYWHINLKNVRTEDLSSYFDYSRKKDILIVETRGTAAGPDKP